MQSRRDHAAPSLSRIPTPSLPFSLAVLGTLWLGLLVYDLIIASTWGDSPFTHGLNRRFLPLVGLAPAAMRLLRAPEIEWEQEAYTVFTRLSIALIAVAVALLLFEPIPFRYSGLATPASFWSFMVGRMAGLITLLGIPLIAEYLCQLYRYRIRSARSRFADFFIYGLILIVVAAQFLPMPYDETMIDHSEVMYVIGGIIGLLSFILAVRTNWVINLKKRQKWALVGLSAAAFLSTAGMMATLQMSQTGMAILQMAPGVHALAAVLGASLLFFYMIIFVSALFALPTAETIDRRNTEVSSLASLARLLTQSLDTGQLVDTAISITCDATGASAAWIELHEGNGSEVLHGSNPRIPAATIRKLMDVPVARGPAIARAMRQRRRVEVIDRLQGITFGYNGTTHEIRSLAAAPLQLGDSLFGTLYVAKERGKGFDREEIVVLNALANQIAMAIEQSRLVQSSIERERFEQEMLIAQDLQQRLLPKEMPQSPLYEIHAESLPASIVGGDYYDVVSFNDGTLGLLVADVSGKGASAALYMGMIKGIIQALAGRYESPRELLAQANVALHGSIDQRWFATMTCAQILESERTLRIARAGHCPTLLVRGGVATYSRPQGLGLAIAKPVLFDRNLQIEEIPFSSGDYAIFFSDGLTEARSPDGEEFGYDALLETAMNAATANPTPRAMRDAIFESINRFSQGVPPTDDSTLVILRWK